MTRYLEAMRAQVAQDLKFLERHFGKDLTQTAHIERLRRQLDQLDERLEQ